MKMRICHQTESARWNECVVLTVACMSNSGSSGLLVAPDGFVGSSHDSNKQKNKNGTENERGGTNSHSVVCPGFSGLFALSVFFFFFVTAALF